MDNHIDSPFNRYFEKMIMQALEKWTMSIGLKKKILDTGTPPPPPPYRSLYCMWLLYIPLLLTRFLTLIVHGRRQRGFDGFERTPILQEIVLF